MKVKQQKDRKQRVSGSRSVGDGQEACMEKTPTDSDSDSEPSSSSAAAHTQRPHLEPADKGKKKSL